MRRVVRASLTAFLALVVALSAQTQAAAYGYWAIPSGHWVGNWIWGTPLSSNTYRHTGVDLWTNHDCTGNWDNGHQGTNVYSPTWGTVQAIYWLTPGYGTTSAWVNSNSKKYGIRIYNSAYNKYLYFWHMANNTNTTSYVMSALYVGENVVQGTQLGGQGDATGVFDTCVHLHFTVSTSSAGDPLWLYNGSCNCVDPSPYMGVDVSWYSANHVRTDTYYGLDYDGDPPSLP